MDDGSKPIQFREALPWLVTARQGGFLVPFVGAGMSMPFCEGWVEFVRKLCADFEHKSLVRSFDGNTNPEKLYRAADRVASWLRLLPPEQRRTYLINALRPTTSVASGPLTPTLPPQIMAMVTVSWPLIVTTNYDNLIVAAIERQVDGHHAPNLPKPLILGRSAEDCIDVVRSLDILQQPIIWYVQGHLSGVVPDTSTRSNEKADALLEQVVLGHQQYQHAINAEPAFRRAFAEVFRRRSLLFLGSGLNESYVVNLISEALFGFGPSTRSHYALFTREEFDRVDAEFLAVRLGITPVLYGESHAQLPESIRQITQLPQRTPKMNDQTTGLASLSYKVKPRWKRQPVDICISHEGLPSLCRPVPRRRSPFLEHCVIVSIGLDWDSRRREFRPYLLGPQSSHFLKAYGVDAHSAKYVPVSYTEPARVFRLIWNGQEQPVFFAAGSIAEKPGQPDVRDLRTISDATREALTAAAMIGFKRVTMGLIGAGKRRPAEPAYCLLAQLDGVRAFLEESFQVAPLTERIDVRVFDTEAWIPLVHGRIPAAELLSSGLARVLVRIVDVRGSYEEFALSVPHQQTIKDVLQSYSIDLKNLNRLKVAATPLTQRSVKDTLEVRVFPGMIVDVRPRLSGR